MLSGWCVCILKVNRTLPCLCVDTFMRNTFRDSGEGLSVQEVPLLFFGGNVPLSQCNVF